MLKSYKFSPRQLPWAVLGDLNGDSKLDLVVDGHAVTPFRRLAFLSPGYTPTVVEKGQWTAGDIAGAIHAPLHLLEDHAAYIDPSLKTYVVWGGGYRSPMAVEILREIGLKDVIDVKGGMADWKAQGLPTTLS